MANLTLTVLSTDIAWESVCGPSRRGLGWVCVAPSTILTFVFIWMLAALTALVAKRLPCFPPLWFAKQTYRHQRNIISYVVGLAVKTVGLIVTLGASYDSVFLNHDLSEDQMRLALMFGFLSVSVLYLWEMVYRIDIDTSLLVHHLATLCLVVLASVAMYEIEQDALRQTNTADAQQLNELRERQDAMNYGRKTVLRLMLVEVLFAMTNQPVLVALLMHRVGSTCAWNHFRIAMYWELVTKLLRFVFVVVLYATMGFSTTMNENCSDIMWCTELRVLYPILAVAIAVANMHMVMTLWRLANRVSRVTDEPEKSSSEDVETPPVFDKAVGVPAHDLSVSAISVNTGFSGVHIFVSSPPASGPLPSYITNA